MSTLSGRRERLDDLRDRGYSPLDCSIFWAEQSHIKLKTTSGCTVVNKITLFAFSFVLLGEEKETANILVDDFWVNIEFKPCSPPPVIAHLWGDEKRARLWNFLPSFLFLFVTQLLLSRLKCTTECNAMNAFKERQSDTWLFSHFFSFM